MNTTQDILINNVPYDCNDAVTYHYGTFPPAIPSLNVLSEPFSEALVSLTRYDTMLRNMLNSSLLLAPLRARDAVISSRMEGTISTLEEVLRLEAYADEDLASSGKRRETIEVALYARALRGAEQQVDDGYSISELIIKNAHQILLSYGRGAEREPGHYKLEQNYIGDKRRKKIEFIPITPELLPSGMSDLIKFIRNDDVPPLLKTAIAHAEFEALHPFDDGNGRLGRMIIPLMLWENGVLSAPHFFVSDYFELNKDEYVERLRNVSQYGDWTGWCKFFLQALSAQATSNITIVLKIQEHYTQMREKFRDVLRSRWSGDALDYIFENPIFMNSRFTRESGIPRQTANNFTNRLVEAGILDVLIHPSGRSPGVYGFPSLLEIVQD